MMDEKSKGLLWIMFILILCVITFTFVKTVILGDFDIVESELMEGDDTEMGAVGTIEADTPVDENFEDIPQEVLGESVELI